MRLVPLERSTTQTLLGICFWDRLTDHLIGEGLQVKAQRLSSDRNQRLGKVVMGRITPSSAIAFFGLATGEIPVNPEQLLWETVPPEQLVAIDMVDRLDRFLPLSFVAQLPFRGAFRGQGEWLSTSLLRPEVGVGEASGVQLWSAPSRPVPPGQAVLRAQIVVGDGENAVPAANALVRVQQSPPVPAGFDYYGLADSRGILLLPMPYPAVPDPLTPETPYPPLDRQTFALNITIQYAPFQTALPGSDFPNLESLLNQPLANIAIHRAADSTLQFESNLSVNLQFERSLILGTALSPGAAEVESVLRIQPT